MSESSSDQELARDLGFLEAYTIGVGTMIGAGIFVLPGIVASSAGPAGMISFAIGGVVSLLTALSLSELATGMPKAGGSYYYVNRAMGSFFGSIVGWSMWAGLMFATAFYMLGFGQYLTFFYGEIPVAGSALVMAAILALINYRGVKEVGVLQNFIVIILIGFILIFLAFGVFNVDWEVFKPFNPHGWGAVASTAATVYVTFIGFEVIATSAEEIKNPGRNLPLSMIASVLTPTILYVLVIFVSTGVLPLDELAASFVPVADVAGEYLGVIGALMMVLGAVLATVSSANASILSAARVNFAMGRDKILSTWLNKIHENYRTPFRAIVITGAVILTLIAFGVGIETLADVASFTFLLTYALVHIAVIVMRRAAPEDYQPDFRLPKIAYPVVPILGAVSCIVIVSQMRPAVLMIGGGIIGLGIVWFLLYAKNRVTKPSLVGDAIVAETKRVKAQGKYRVVVPLANPASEQYLIKMGGAICSAYNDSEIVAISVLELPQQVSLKQGIEFEDERIERQKELLNNARSTAEKFEIGLRTRSIVGRRASSIISDVTKEERAKHLVMGWSGKHNRFGHILGSTLDRVVSNTECEITLVKPGQGSYKNILVLVGTGPNTVRALKRAKEFMKTLNFSRLTLLNVTRSSSENVEESKLEGRHLIQTMAKEAGLEESEYQEKIFVADDVRGALLEEAANSDAVFIGATRSTKVHQAIFGSIPEELGEKLNSMVVISRGPIHKPRSVMQGIIEWLTIKNYN